MYVYLPIANNQQVLQCLLPNRKLPHFPLGSFLASYQEHFSSLTEKLPSSPPIGKFPHFPPGSLLFSHREASFFPPILMGNYLPPIGKFPHFPPGSFLSSPREASFLSYLLGNFLPPIRKFPHFPLGSFLTFQVNLGRLYWRYSTKDALFNFF